MLEGVHYVRKQGGTRMSQKAFLLTAGAVFVLLALGHLLRILFGVAFVVYDIPVPMWASGIDLRVSGGTHPPDTQRERVILEGVAGVGG